MATAKALVEAGIFKKECRGPGSKEFRRLIFLRLYGRDFDTKKRKKIIDYLQGAVNARHVVEPDHKISTSGDPDRYYKGG